MDNIDLTNYLPILSMGLWVGIFIVFVCKMFSFVIDKILSWFKRAI